MPLGLKVEKAYPSDSSIVHWRGSVFTDTAEFDLFLRGPVRARVTDQHFQAQVSQDLQALATTEMATATLESLLSATVDPLDWEVGEAMAECLLTDEFGVQWPWNENRDRKTPRASLPGADLVGILGEGDEAVLFFGEVKTSSDANSPPGVMAGRGGLKHQIDTLAASTEIHFALVQWLAARCKNSDLWTSFMAACSRYLKSGGKDFVIVGVLLRDTMPHENDLRTRGEALTAVGAGGPRTRLDAWYTPLPISHWAKLALADT